MMPSLARFEPGSLRRIDPRLALLISQSVSLGIMLALLIITASALFLTTYGSQTLPYVYITVAISGSAMFYGFSELLRRWSLPSVSLITLAIVALTFFLSWIGLRYAGASWISFLLMVSFSLVIQMGFVIIGGQAGRLFDVREVKRLFPRIVAGFAIGFMVGGFIGALLANFVKQTENLLLVSVLATLAMSGFLFWTDRRYHETLVQATPVSGQHQQANKPLWQLLVKRFVLLLVLYQMFSAMVSDLVSFMFFDQVAARFPDSQGLAGFMGNFTIAVNLTDVLFLSLFAGLLLSRFGLRFGLGANPFVDGLLLLIEVIVLIAFGSENQLFFWLVIITRIVDITLTDGTTRGSINTAYQALPSQERVTVQTGVEGIGVPVALGLTGVILLIYNAISGLSIVYLALFTVLITVLWAATGLYTYRDYATSLIQGIRRRRLDPAELSIDDQPTMRAVERILHEGQISEIRMVLDLLVEAVPDLYKTEVTRLASHQDPEIVADALNRIERARLGVALPAIRRALEVDSSPTIKVNALKALCAVKTEEAVDEVLPYLNDDDPGVRLGASVGLLRYGGNAGALAAGSRLRKLEKSVDPLDRMFVAEVIGQVGLEDFYRPLITLLQDPDYQVRRSALAAAGQVGHQQLMPYVILNLDQPQTRAAAMSALITYGEALIPAAQDALDEKAADETTIRLVRACGQVKGDNTVRMLVNYLDYPDGLVRQQILSALSQCSYQAAKDERPSIQDRLEAEIRWSSHILAFHEDILADEATEPLHRALEDEIQFARQRSFLLLSFLYDSRAILRAEDQLASKVSTEQALALETLDVMLSGDHKVLLFPLADPRLTWTQRRQQLNRLYPINAKNQDARLVEIINQEDGQHYSSWLRACAVYAAGKLGLKQATPGIEASLAAGDGPLREAAVWALFQLAPARYQIHATDLADDPDPKLQRLVVYLAKEIADQHHGDVNFEEA